jgi:allantoin racemase
VRRGIRGCREFRASEAIWPVQRGGAASGRGRGSRPVRAITPASDTDLLLEAVADPFQNFIPRFEAVAAECIRDGAEVIVVGCGYYGPLLRAAGYAQVPSTGVTVLDATTVSIKYLEAMTDIALGLGYVKSSANSLSTPPSANLNAARRSLGLA